MHTYIYTYICVDVCIYAYMQTCLHLHQRPQLVEIVLQRCAGEEQAKGRCTVSKQAVSFQVMMKGSPGRAAARLLVVTLFNNQYTTGKISFNVKGSDTRTSLGPPPQRTTSY